MAKLRLGIIGAGSWTVSSHLPNLERHRDEVEFTIVNRRDPELLRRIAERHGFERATTDWREVIAERPDIVVDRKSTRRSLGAGQGGTRSRGARPVREALHHRSRPTPGISRRPSAAPAASCSWPMAGITARWSSRPTGSCTTTAASARSSTWRCTWTRSLASCCPRPARTPTRLRNRSRARNLVAAGDLGGRLRPGPADPPARRVAVADRPPRPGRLRVDERAARGQRRAPRRGRASGTRTARSGR